MVLILALETTEKFGSVALLDDQRILSEKPLPTDRRSAQTLAPALDEILKQQGVSPKEIDCVAVVVGPGSFTGLRVGVAAAKVFAYAVGAKVVALNTFETIAAALDDGLAPAVHSVSIGVDAQRGDVVAQRFERRDKTFKPMEAAQMIPVKVWWEQANTVPDLRFAGPALERWQTKIPDDSPEHLVFVDKTFWFPSAALAGLLAAKRWESGQFDDLWSLAPIYSRLSAAEEKRSAMRQ